MLQFSQAKIFFWEEKESFKKPQIKNQGFWSPIPNTRGSEQLLNWWFYVLIESSLYPETASSHWLSTCSLILSGGLSLGLGTYDWVLAVKNESRRDMVLLTLGSELSVCVLHPSPPLKDELGVTYWDAGSTRWREPGPLSHWITDSPADPHTSHEPEINFCVCWAPEI